MQLMSPASILGIAIGASLMTVFSKKNKEKTKLRRLGLFLGGFTSVFIIFSDIKAPADCPTC